MRTTGLIRALVSIIITGIAAGGCVTPNAAKVLKSIALTPSAPVLSIAAVQPLTATATFDDGSTEDVTTAVDWSSSDDTIANLSMASGSEGKVTALKPGTVTITATDALTKVFATTTLVVSPATLTSLRISPRGITIPKGTKQQYSATGTFSDGTSREVTTTLAWHSSDVGTATIDAMTALASAQQAGAVTISVADPVTALSDSVSLTISSAALTRVDVTPANSSFPKGTTQQLTATGVYSDGTTHDLTPTAVWTSSDETIATFNTSAGVATGLLTGSVTVSAKDTATGISGTVQLTVSSATLTALGVALLSSYPDPLKLPQGLAVQFTALGTFSDGSTSDATQLVQWTSSDAAKLAVSDAIGSKGQATAPLSASFVGQLVTVTAAKPGAPGVAAALTLRITFPQPTATSPQPSDLSSETTLNARYTNDVHNPYEAGTEGYFVGSNTTKNLHYRLFNTPNEKGLVLILTGRAEPTVKYQEVVYDLRAQGYSVYLMDHRSQGSSDRLTSDPQMGYVDSFQNYVDDVDLYVRNFVKPAQHTHLFLLTHELGAAIATMYLAQHPGIFQAAAFSSPMFALNPATFAEAATLTSASAQCTQGDGKVFAQGQGDFQAMAFADAGNVFTRSQVRFDIAQQLFANFPTLETGGASYRWLCETLGATGAIPALAPAAATPMLVFEAGHEDVVKLQAESDFCDNAPLCQKIVYPDSYDHIWMERDAIRNDALARTIRFFNQF